MKTIAITAGHGGSDPGSVAHGENVEMPIGATLTIDPTGSVILVDTTTPAGSTATRTRAHTANTSGVIIKSTGTANTLAVSGS